MFKLTESRFCPALSIRTKYHYLEKRPEFKILSAVSAKCLQILSQIVIKIIFLKDQVKEKGV